MNLLTQIKNWFVTAKPNPTNQNIIQQIAYHFEEVAEMLIALHCNEQARELLNLKDILLSYDELQCQNLLSKVDKVALLDALADQTVTAVGVAYMAKLDFQGALTEVNESNWSKFENGKPVIDDKGKIIKGKDYFKPQLDKFIQEDIIDELNFLDSFDGVTVEGGVDNENDEGCAGGACKL